LERITYTPLRRFTLDDREFSYFAQDHWDIVPRVTLDVGIRTESQQISHAWRVAPRGGLAINLFREAGTMLRMGLGHFYEHVPLNAYAFNRFPDQIITRYGPDGSVISGPILYLNTLGQNRVRFPFVRQSPIDGNFSPRSVNWSIEVEQPIVKSTKVRVR